MSDIESVREQLWARIRELQKAGGTIRNYDIARRHGGLAGNYSIGPGKNPPKMPLCLVGMFDSAMGQDTEEAAKQLGITVIEASILEAGFESWDEATLLDVEGDLETVVGYTGSLEGHPLYKLGEEIAAQLDKEEGLKKAQAVPSE